MADWGILQMQDVSGAALGGFRAGQAMGRQRRLDEAMQSVDMERPESFLPLLREDPQTGAALMGASMRISSERRQQESQVALGKYAQALSGFSNSVPAASSGTEAAGATASPVPAAPITAPAAPQHPDSAALRNELLQKHPELFDKVMAMDEAQRKRVGEAHDAIAALRDPLLKLPYAERRGYLARHREMLTSHGLDPQTLDGFEPTDESIDAVYRETLGAKALTEHATAFQQNYNWIRENLGEEVAQNYLTRETSPVTQTVTGPNGETIQLSQQPPGAVPEGAIQHLRQNPGLAADFDRKYGKGKSQQYLQGGAGSGGPQTFP